MLPKYLRMLVTYFASQIKPEQLHRPNLQQTKDLSTIE